MRRYRLQKAGLLYLTKAAVKGPTRIHVLQLLVDTGSTYTILPLEAFDIIGVDVAHSREQTRIATGSGMLVIPKVRVDWLQVMGVKKMSFSVLAHTLPFAGPIDGLLVQGYAIVTV